VKEGIGTRIFEHGKRFWVLGFINIAAFGFIERIAEKVKAEIYSAIQIRSGHSEVCREHGRAAIPVRIARNPRSVSNRG
jgi:hypothetical protein